MARFNSPKATVADREVTNLAGGKALPLSDKRQIVNVLLTSFMKNQYYRNAEDSVELLADLVKNAADKLFVAKAAIFARREFGMRSVTHIAAAEIAKAVKGESWTKRFIKTVIYRPDDMLEIMGYYVSKYGRRPLPNSLKKGFASAFNEFDSHQIGKYKGEGKKIKMIDLVNLIHPSPVSKNETALSELVADKLKVSGTWEAKLTEAGQKAETEEQKTELKAEAWADLIRSKKIGYFALLRNLRNIISQAPHMTDDACKLLCDEGLIRKSLVMPFRFSTAAAEIEKIGDMTSRNVVMAINKAVDISCKNVPKFEGKTLVALDVSGSMSGQPAQIGALFTAVIAKSNNADVMVFGDDAEYMKYNPMDSVLTIASKFKNKNQGTDFDPIFTKATQPYHRIIILSDMQAWVTGRRPEKVFQAYKTKFKCDPFIYSFDLQGYGTTQFNDTGRVIEIAGFSDKILEIMVLCEQDREALIHKIESIEF